MSVIHVGCQYLMASEDSLCLLNGTMMGEMVVGSSVAIIKFNHE